MILSREEFFERLRGYTENFSDDGTLTFVEDMTDTYNDLESRVRDNGETWKAKYDELDKEWKKRYWERFFKGDGYSTPNERGTEEEEVKVNEEITIDDLFVEEEDK